MDALHHDHGIRTKVATRSNKLQQGPTRSDFPMRHPDEGMDARAPFHPISESRRPVTLDLPRMTAGKAMERYGARRLRGCPLARVWAREPGPRNPGNC